MTNRYTSSNSTIIAGAGTMFNETTHIRETKHRVNENTNTYSITVPIQLKPNSSTKSKTRKSHKSKSKKVK